MTADQHVERTITIQAPRDTVFRFFTDTTRWATWWGAGSTIDARPGGRLLIRHPDGTEVAGEVLDIQAPQRLSFSYGFVSGKPIPSGSSRVTIQLEPEGSGTRLSLHHDLPDAGMRDEFMQGWRFQLALFINVVANEVHAGATGLVDEWFAAWRDTDADARERSLARIASADLRYRDRFSSTTGVADLVPHITAAHRFMPDLRLERRGDVRQCQGMALVEWVALAGDGRERASGTNVFVFAADGRIDSVTGFWRM